MAEERRRQVVTVRLYMGRLGWLAWKVQPAIWELTFGQAKVWKKPIKDREVQGHPADMLSQGLKRAARRERELGYV